MVILVSILASVVTVIAVTGWLVRAGFRNGDMSADAAVCARAAAPEDAFAAGTWVQVSVFNPASATALVALGLGTSRFASTAGRTERRTAGARARLALADQAVGAVLPDEEACFWLWADGELRRLRVTVAIGTPGRLRLHRLPVAVSRSGGGFRGRVRVVDAYSQTGDQPRANGDSRAGSGMRPVS